ncbi:hypothetical protein DFH07DRAFT_955402 [Mycena maculata]|uniref:NADH:flavin oxidoreductase/NADH oxidase N-terminal domain-containing protein n=1 Tax=Mycena maculata TaxID=230809 RepID=A0AAD7NMF4_9AGAR|nr:hypothetical protein DFH07DRAFT_955402 [Mycena maculata]
MSQLFQPITLGPIALKHRVVLAPLTRLKDPTLDLVSASDIPSVAGAQEKPRPLTVAEIEEYVGLYAQAAKNAMEAGFDGVEIHDANGCLLDQFLQDVSNNRTDTYGGSAENRARFPLGVVKAVTDAVGQDRTGIRLSPWSPFAGMGMADPVPTFTHLVSGIARLYPELAYLSLIEPRISADVTVEASPENAAYAGGYTRATAIQLADRNRNALVAFGRTFIANPDLPIRLEKGIPLHPYDRSTFYLPGEEPKGYTDQPFATVA